MRLAENIFKEVGEMLTTQDLMKDLEWLLDVPAGKEPRRYPLTNISYDDNKVFVDVAVAGFGPDDIDIELEGDTLIITGEKSEEKFDEDRQFVQKHISSESFERKIKLHPDFVSGDISATYKNGILGISITKKEKPKKLISIVSE